MLAESYHSDLVQRIKESDFRFQSGRLEVHLAREFGFCYGVDRAVDYAYQTRKRFPDRTVFLTGEIIHNPHVNDQLRAQGIRFLTDARRIDGRADRRRTSSSCRPSASRSSCSTSCSEHGCTLVDTTCGSVLNVWKNVKRYAEDGFTSIIHGKYWHEETRATASQALLGGRGHYLVVLNEQRSVVRLRLHPRHTGGRPPRSFSIGSSMPPPPASIPIATCSGSAARTRRRC